MTLAATIRTLVREMAWTRSSFTVEYMVKTPSGRYARFTRRSQLSNMYGNPQSETAVLNYLRKLHPGTDISIISLEFD